MEIWRCDMQVREKKQVQRGDVFEEYKHNLVGVKKQLNCLHKDKWSFKHDWGRDMIKNGQDNKCPHSCQSKIIIHSR
jgi:hypothetical protein